MITAGKIYRDQSKYGFNSALSDTEKVSYESYIAGCRRAFSDLTPKDYYEWDIKKKTDFTDQLIVNYVKDNLKAVDGYMDENGDLRQEDLIDRLRIDINGAGVLKRALEDDTVDRKSVV